MRQGRLGPTGRKRPVAGRGVVGTGSRATVDRTPGPTRPSAVPGATTRAVPVRRPPGDRSGRPSRVLRPHLRPGRGRPHSDGPPPRRPEGLLSGRTGCRRHQGRAREGRAEPGGRRVRDHGAGAHRGGGPDPGPAGRGEGRHPDDRPRPHDQQGVPLRASTRSRSPTSSSAPASSTSWWPAARSRCRRPRTCSRLAAGLQVRRRPAARPHAVRRPVGRVHRPGDGRADRSRQRGGPALLREEQDAFSARSHQLAAQGWKNGLYDDEVVPVPIPQRKGEPLMFKDDEGIRPDTTVETLARLRPAFRPDGTITAGSASQISDGAAAVVVMSRAKAEELGLTWLAEIGAHGVVAGPDSTLQHQPARAIRRALRQGGHRGRRPGPRRDQRGVRRGRGWPPRGAGHRPRDDERQRRRDRPRSPHRDVGRPARAAPRPRAARRGGGIGAAGLCGGGGQGDALLLRVPARADRAARRRTAAARRSSPVTPDVPALLEQAREGRRARSHASSRSSRTRRRRCARSPPRSPRTWAARGSSGSPGRRASASRRRRPRSCEPSGSAGSGSGCSPSTPRHPSPAEPCSVTASGCRTTHSTPASSSDRWPPAATSAGSPGPRRRPSGCSTGPASTSCSSRRSASGRARSRSPALADVTVVLLAPGMGDGVQAAKAGILEVGDVFVVNKADRDGAQSTMRDLRHMISSGCPPGRGTPPTPRRGGRRCSPRSPRRGRGGRSRGRSRRARSSGRRAAASCARRRLRRASARSR